MRIATSLLACLLACGGTESRENDDPTDEDPLDMLFPDRCAASSCAVGPTITSVNELVAIIEATSDWVQYGPYTRGCLPASADIRISGTMTVGAGDVDVPVSCQQPGCRKAVWFRASSLPPGVECVGPEQWYEFTLCAGLTLRDTTVRLRMVMQDIHPSDANFVSVVDVLPACASPCSSTEHACPATHTCWADPRDQCAYCLGGSNEACACWNGTAFDADGTRCEVAISGDVYVPGSCRAGTCMPDR
jgi:hypothetical protein